MSIFTRPDSPPPRQPSPDFIPAPLPSPHLRGRLRNSASKASLATSSTYSPAAPPGLNLVPHPHRPVPTVRSYDHLSSRPSRATASEDCQRKRTRSTVTASPPSTPRSLQLPSSSYSGDEFTRPHRRCLSNAVPYRSPPPSPTISLAPPPVPPIPAFVLTPPVDLKKSPRASRASSAKPIRLHNLDSLTPMSESTGRTRKQSHSPPSSEKKSVGMTCLKFFSLRNPRQRAAKALDA